MSVIVTSKAEKSIQAMEASQRQEIKAIIDSMEINLNSLKKKKLQCYNDRWRIRHGDWRIIYQEVKQEGSVYVLDIKQRKDAYK
ncbi:MAG: type II toxin-antitoxin system RelE/ParE family toxin [Candidatus Xenobiia bacterium LiM19]